MQHASRCGVDDKVDLIRAEYVNRVPVDIGADVGRDMVRGVESVNSPGNVHDTIDATVEQAH